MGKTEESYVLKNLLKSIKIGADFLKIAIIGSRNLSDPEKVYTMITQTIPRNCSEVVSGGAFGVDKLAERYAREHHLYLKLFLPNYDRYGISAPLIRNDEIVEYSDMVYAFWDMNSRGTRYALKKCIEIQKPVKIIRID